MEPIQFGSYLFLGHPRVVSWQEQRTTASHLLPGVGQQVESLGPGVRTVELEGELLGGNADEAMAAYNKLRACYHTGATELLFLPGQAPFHAVFERLELTGEGDGRLLRYRARFLEESTQRGTIL